MKKRKRQQTNVFASPKNFLLLFITGIFLAFTLIVIPKLINQKIVDDMVKKAEYPELVGKAPTFWLKVNTPSSTTYVLSYLPKTLLPREKFNESAAQAIITYVEQIAQKNLELKFNLYKNTNSLVETKLISRERSKNKRVNFVIIFSRAEPLPKKILDIRNQYRILSNALDLDGTFYWTEVGEHGATSFLRFAESNTFKYGLPTINNERLSPQQQVNFGFNVEIWKRSSTTPGTEDSAKDYDIRESLWNTFGQTVLAAQESIPISLMKERFSGGPISRMSPRLYYPLDEKSKKIYDGAPKIPVIR